MLEQLIKKMRELLNQAEAIESKDRAKSVYDLFWQVDEIFWAADEDEFGGFHWLIDVFADEGGMFAITSSDGKMFRWPISLDGNDEIVLGESQQVRQDFPTVNQSISVHRAANGHYYALALLSTSVLNKDGEIDSTALFDSFVDRFGTNYLHEMPGGFAFTPRERVNFHHIDSVEAEFGSIKSVYRSGVCLWAVIEFDDTEMGRAVAETLAADEDGEWGISIEFVFNLESNEFIEVNGVRIRVFNEGTLHRASVVKNSKAAAWFTAIPAVAATMERDMKKEITDAIKSDLTELVGDDLASSMVESASAHDDDINTRVAEEGMISRDADEESVPGEADSAEDAVAEAEVELDVEVELNDAVLGALAESEPIKAIEGLVNGLAENVQSLAQSLEDALATLNKSADDMATAHQAAIGRIDTIEQRMGGVEEETERQQDELRRGRRKFTVVVPESTGGADSETQGRDTYTAADALADTLNNLGQ